METKYIILIIAIVLVIFITLLVLLFIKKKKTNKFTIDKEFIDSLVNALGNIKNISSVKVDNGRLKFTVLDLETVNFEYLKSISTAGVFITGSNIKMLFQYDAKIVEKAISTLIKEA